MYIETRLHGVKLDDGKERMDRCPILKGDKTWDEVHPPAPPADPQDPDPPADQLRVQGKVKVRTIILGIIVIALIAIPGGIIWFIQNGGF